LRDGLAGFRAVADMTWALSLCEGPYVVIAYDALLRSLFATSRATGLCLYNRTKMPLDVIDGACYAHPLLESAGGFRRNAKYEPRITPARTRKRR
jgi:DcmR-like sensory protein